MGFSTGFLLASVFAACFSLLFFGLPGLLSAAMLGIKNRNFSTLLLAPALGLCFFGPFALLFCWLLGFSLVNILTAWLIFLLSIYLSVAEQQQQWYKRLVSVKSLYLVAAIMLWAIIPPLNIYPFIYENGLFVNAQIFDHMKISIVDSIVREGLPPLNPYYAPEGERISLVYYYAWHFDAAMIRLITGVSSWQAEVAFSWFSSFSAMGFLAAMAIRITGKQLAGFFVVLLALTGSPADVLPEIAGHRWEQWLGYPGHLLEVIWIQLSWAPQHVFSALSSVVLLFLISHALINKHLRWQHAMLIGLTAAAGFGASVWVGGIALACSAPFLLIALRLFAVDCSKMTGPLLLALLVCVIFAIPVLTSITSGPPSGTTGIPLKIKLYLSTGLFDAGSVQEKAGHFILYWIKFLPLTFGIVYILGILSIATYKPGQTENRIFYYLSFTAIFTHLILVQFVQSDIVNNDFGWRTACVPVMLLLIWGATLLTELPLTTSSWSPFAIKLSRHPGFMPLTWAGITLGLIAAFFYWQWPKPYLGDNEPSRENLALRQDFYRQDVAWQAIRRHTAYNDIVQSNPDSYARVVTPWPAPAPLALFANRATAFAEPESVNVFAHSYDKLQKNKQYKAVQAIFSAHPQTEVLLYARDKLKIKALLIDHRDPVWATDALEASGVFSLVEQHPDYKIYLAK